MVTSQNCEVGRCVKRGRDWKWGTSDHNNPGKGRITKCWNDRRPTGEMEDQMANVTWESGVSGIYRIGNESAYDLRYHGGNVISFISLLLFNSCNSLVDRYRFLFTSYFRVAPPTTTEPPTKPTQHPEEISTAPKSAIRSTTTAMIKRGTPCFI